MVAWQRPSDQAIIVLLLILAAGLPEIWSMSARAAASAKERPSGVPRALILQRFVTGVAIVLALLLGLGVIGVAAAFFLGTLVGWLAHVRATAQFGCQLDLSLLKWTEMRQLFGQTLLVGSSAIVLVVLFRADAVLLGIMVGDGAVAEYIVAYRLLETVLFIFYAINQSIQPVMSESVDTARARKAYEQGLTLAGFFYLPFAAVAVLEGEQIVGALFGASYAESSGATLAWLAPAPLLFAACFFAGSLLTSRDRQRPILVAAVIATVVNIGLNLVLIPRYESVGAAAATSVSFAIQIVVLIVALRKAEQPVSLVRPLLVSSLAAAVLTGLLLVSSCRRCSSSRSAPRSTWPPGSCWPAASTRSRWRSPAGSSAVRPSSGASGPAREQSVARPPLREPYGGPSPKSPRMRDGVDCSVGVGPTRLVALVSAQQSVLPGAGTHGVPDGMGHQHRADGDPVVVGVTSTW